MARPTARENRFFWELIIAFTLIVCAAVFQTFHFFNNAWLTQNDSFIEYQRGLGDDCVKSEDFSDEAIRCSGWGASSAFVLNGKGVRSEDVVQPSAGLQIARVLMVINVVLYLVVIGALFVVCIKKRDLKVQRILCAASVLLILLNLIVILLVAVASCFPFIRNKGNCSLGSAYYFFLLSNMLLWIASVSHFDSWRDVYLSLKNVHFLTHAEMHGNPNWQKGEMGRGRVGFRGAFLRLKKKDEDDLWHLTPLFFCLLVFCSLVVICYIVLSEDMRYAASASYRRIRQDLS